MQHLLDLRSLVVVRACAVLCCAVLQKKNDIGIEREEILARTHVRTGEGRDQPP